MGLAYGLEHLSHATLYRTKDTWYFHRVDEWLAKRDAIAVFLEDMPKLAAAAKHTAATPHPTNPNAATIDPRPGIRLVSACEGMANALYAAAEIVANFANLASHGGIPSSFNKIRERCEANPPPEFAAALADLQWYRKVRELRTEWTHFSAIFLGRDQDGEPILCVRSFRRRNDREEFTAARTFCRVGELCDWVKRATVTLERFAGYLLIRYVIPRFDLEREVTSAVRDELGFPRQYEDGRCFYGRRPGGVDFARSDFFSMHCRRQDAIDSGVWGRAPSGPSFSRKSRKCYVADAHPSARYRPLFAPSPRPVGVRHRQECLCYQLPTADCRLERRQRCPRY